MNLHNAHVLLSGASRGLGEAMARKFAESGATLTLVARNEGALASLANDLGCTFIAGDLLDEAFVETLVEHASQGSPIDVLVNNAGMEHVGHVAEQTPEQIRSVFRLNLEVPAVLTRDVLGTMLQRNRGHIVNISSMAMAVNTPGFATYGASKSGLSAFSNALSEELKHSGVRVTTVEIGTADTDMLDDLRSSPVKGVFDRYEKLGMSPLLAPADVAAAIAAGIERDKRHVRLPRRQAALPMLVNIPRALGNALTRDVSTS